MKKLFPLLKDFILSAVIALFTTDKLGLSNLLYQVLIFILILALIYIFLWKIGRLSKRLEILSILYCENFIIKILEALESAISNKLECINPIKKAKLFIILPESFEDFKIIENRLHNLKTIQIPYSNNSKRIFNLYGQIINDDSALFFDTPVAWYSGIGFYILSKKLNNKQAASLLENMNRDIVDYAKKYHSEYYSNGKLKFITIKEFNTFFE